KDYIFNFTRVTKEEFDEYLNSGFINDKFKTERLVYFIIFIIFNIFALVSLVLFHNLRNSYIIRQRNYRLTFAFGIFTYISVIFSFIPQFMKVPCTISVFSANILNTVVNFLFLSRGLRVILFYHFNIFKVNTIKQRRLEGENRDIIEPNCFFPKITRKINIIIAAFVITPTAIAVLAVIIIYIVEDMNQPEKCPMFIPEDAMLNLKKNKGKELYSIVVIYGVLYSILNFVSAVLLLYVKDTSKYGLKFECLSVSIMILVFNFLNIFLQNRCSTESFYNEIIKTNRLPRRGYMTIFEKTKGGKILYTFVTIYMFFTSISLPIIRYALAKHKRDDYSDDPLSSINYFYRVLNTSSLVAELREIAIKEFSVENVLFWENYQLLRKMISRYQIEYNKAKEMGDEKIISQYDFENFFQQQQQHPSLSTVSGSETGNENGTYSLVEESSLDPRTPVPKEILPYYNSFYFMFIDFNGPAVVNLLGETVKHIVNEMCSTPTIGMYDAAKNEVVDMMFSSIYPILIEKNKNHISETLG
ncbi:hypothetical protein U3516DRAFT_564477, partial [Neocallimastix sp. 'constans']